MEILLLGAILAVGAWWFAKAPAGGSPPKDVPGSPPSAYADCYDAEMPNAARIQLAKLLDQAKVGAAHSAMLDAAADAAIVLGQPKAAACLRAAATAAKNREKLSTFGKAIGGDAILTGARPSAEALSEAALTACTSEITDTATRLKFLDLLRQAKAGVGNPQALHGAAGAAESLGWVKAASCLHTAALLLTAQSTGGAVSVVESAIEKLKP